MSSVLDEIEATAMTLVSNLGDAVEVDAGSTTVLDAIDIFRAREISCLPVYLSVDGDKMYVGVLTMADIVGYIIKLIMNEKSVASNLRQPVMEALGYTPESSLDPSISLEEESTPLSTIVSKMSQGIHHAIVRRGAEPAKIITQTDVVRYFLQFVDTFSKIEIVLLQSIQSLIEEDHLESVLESSPLLVAMQRLSTHSALPVVDEWGSIVATLSSSDFRDINSSTDFASYRAMTVKDYLASIDARRKFKHPIFATPDTSMMECAKTMVSFHLHRLYVVRPSMETGVSKLGVGCVSLTDIIKAVAAEPETRRIYYTSY